MQRTARDLSATEYAPFSRSRWCSGLAFSHLDKLSLNMTGIAMASVKGGLVIGADGRTRWDDPSTADEETRRKLDRDDVQKIFGVEDLDRSLAYALTGSISNKDGSWNLAAEVHK